MAKVIKRLRNLVIKVYNIPVRGKFKQCETLWHPLSKADNKQYISLGKAVVIGKQVWLYAITTDEAGNKFTPDLVIKEGATIGRFSHITCSNTLVLDKHVFVSERVLITDSIHGYKDINTPIYYQPLISCKRGVHIGEGTWLGDGASIVGNVTIGKGCVIGTNAVVANMDIPDYCVVGGNPAKITKRYNPITREWDNLNLKTTFRVSPKS